MKVRIEAHTPNARNSIQWCNKIIRSLTFFLFMDSHYQRKFVKNLNYFFCFGGIHPLRGPTRRGVRSRGEGRRRRNEARRGRRRRGTGEGGGWRGGGWAGNRSSWIDGAAVGGYLECEEAECEGNVQEVAEKCGGEGEAGEMGDGVVN